MRLKDGARVTYGSKITDKIWEDNNGQLVIRDAVLARCGSYDYLESEIVPNGNPSKVVQVYRRPEDVFDPASIASFENKPFCNDHPDDDVCPENARELQCGFIRDIRQGTGDLSECLIGDIIVTDPEVIDLIKTGKKRELSLGYNTQIIKGDDGKYYMTKIRGNHLALVDSGRAGNATIRDKKTVNKIQKGDVRMARKVIFKTKNRDKFINSLYDEDIVKIEELEDDEDVVVENLPEDETDTVIVEETTTEECPETGEIVKDDDIGEQLAELKGMLQQIIEMLSAQNASAEEVVEEPVATEQADEEVPAEQVETESDEPKLFDAGEEVEEAAEDLTQAIEEEEDEEEDLDEALTDSASVYANLVNVGDQAPQNTQDEINLAHINRYKKFGGKN